MAECAPVVRKPRGPVLRPWPSQEKRDEFEECVCLHPETPNATLADMTGLAKGTVCGWAAEIRKHLRADTEYERDVNAVLDLRRAGLTSQRKIAREVGVTVSFVHQQMRRCLRCWVLASKHNPLGADGVCSWCREEA